MSKSQRGKLDVWGKLPPCPPQLDETLISEILNYI